LSQGGKASSNLPSRHEHPLRRERLAAFAEKKRIESKREKGTVPQKYYSDDAKTISESATEKRGGEVI